MKRLNKHGDTIVEVLIALTVTSVLLAGAYATTNNALNSARASQERAEALKVAESQVENLRSIATPPASTPVSFCMDAGSAVPDSSAICTKGIYKTTITHSTNPNLFTVSVDWERVGGKRTENLKLTYAVF